MPHAGPPAPRQFLGVMVSSTFADFKQHREAVIKAIGGQGLHPIAMEQDSALPDGTVIDSSLQKVRDGAAYIGIIGARYGNIPDSPERNPENLSLTELEFREARDLNRPILLFIMGPDHDVKRRDVESDPEKNRKLEAFRQEAKRSSPGSSVHRVYKEFNSLSEFEVAATQFVAALHRFLDKEAATADRPSTQVAPAPTSGGHMPDGPKIVSKDLASTIPSAVSSGGWEEFDPGLLHCLVVGSESLAGDGPEKSLAALVTEMLSSPQVRKLWSSFRRAWEGRELLRSGPRLIPADYSNANVRVASFNVVDAFTSRTGLDRVVKLIVQSDLALFDVTGFEPALMLLLGIRAATRRGVTINSHGGSWLEGYPLKRPFNLSDLSLSSHTPPAERFVGPDQRINRLIERICTGFDQLACQPHYLDLPVYDALRQLGPQENAWGSIPLEEQVLILCSYDHKYFSVWQDLRLKLKNALFADGVVTDVIRLQDLATPQLVSQSLYERLRRSAGCVADWTGPSPSTFFELGVRLAVSQWSVAQIVEENWLHDTINETGGKKYYAKQIERMCEMLDPLRYRGIRDYDDPALYRGIADTDIGSRIAQQLIEIRRRIKGSRGHQLHQVAAEALGPVQERLARLSGQLIDEADALDHKDRVRDNVPQALFYEVPEINKDYEKAALERRLAAWLYLEHRVDAARLDDTDQRKNTWRELGKIVASDLYLSDDEADQDLADKITQRLT